MKRVLFLVCALVLAPGCSFDSPESNQSPTAHVPAISYEIVYGDTVQLSGYGDR